MSDFPLVSFLVRLGGGALAAFCAILFWPRNRDAAWVFVILGTLILYLKLVFDLLLHVKLLTPEYFVVAGRPLYDVIDLVLAVLPYLLLASAFIIKVARK